MNVRMLQLASLACASWIALPAHASGSATADLAAIAPEAVAAIKLLFPSGSIAEFSRESEMSVSYFEVVVQDGDRRVEVEVTAEGEIGEVEDAISLNELPSAVRDAISASTGGASIQSVERHEVHGVPKGGAFYPVSPPRIVYEVSYLAGGARREMTLDAEGRVLVPEEEDDDDGGDDDTD